MTALSPLGYEHMHKNYVVYDPETGSTSKDYSKLFNSKVILVGERNDCFHLQENFQRVLKMVAKGKSCLLVEKLAPGIKVDKKAVEIYENLPDCVDAVGADIKGYTDLSKYVNITNLLWHTAMNRGQFALAYQKDMIALANLLNKLFEDKHFHINDCDYRIDESEWDNFITILESRERRNPLDEIQKDAAKLRADSYYVTELQNGRIVKTNKGFLEGILKAVETYEKVFACWELRHIVGNRELYAKLKERKIEVIVLLPAPEVLNDLGCKAPSEIQKSCTLTMNVRERVAGDSIRCGNRTSISIPPSLITLYQQGVRPAFHYYSDSSPIFLTPDELKNRLDGGNLIMLPSHRPITFVNVDYIAAAMVSDHVSACRGINEAYLDRMFNRFTLMHGIGDLDIEFGAAKLEVNFHVHNGQICLSFTSDKQVTIQVSREKILIDPHYFFETIRGKGFTLERGRRLTFVDVHPDDVAAIKEDHDVLDETLTKYVPDGVEVYVEGPYSLDIAENVTIIAAGTVRLQVEDIVEHNRKKGKK